MNSFKIENGLNGSPIVPGDKSISHRSIIIPSIANGVSEIQNILNSEDVQCTLNAFRLMGVDIREINDKIIIIGRGLNSLKEPQKEIYLGNSGTSARLLIGLLASQKFNTKLTGDKSLSSRPMNRITEPLKNMNAKIMTTKGTLPVNIFGQKLEKVIVLLSIKVTRLLK